MNELETLGAVLKRFLESKEYWGLRVHETFGTADFTVDGTIGVSLKEAAVIETCGTRRRKQPKPKAGVARDD